MKLEREALLHYIDATFKVTSSTPSSFNWFLIGKDIEEMAVELNPDIETSKNILGETSVKDNGYEPEMDADPYYANPDDPIYPKLKEIAFGRLKGDSCKTYILEVIVEDTSDSSHTAYLEEVVVKPQSYGGGTEGVNIPFNVYFNGNRIAGTVTMEGKTPTFTKNS